MTSSIAPPIDVGSAWERRQLLWLAYLPLVGIEAVMDGANARTWFLLSAGTASFVVVFLLAIRGIRGALPALVVIAAALGLAFAPTNLGAVVFLAYSAGAAAHLRRSDVAIASMIAIVVASAIESWITGQVIVFSLGGMLASCIGMLSLYLERYRRTAEGLRLANAEIERLGAIAERERIARDLHDVLGHTLTLISIKADLAARLAERDATGAVAELRDVRQASRSALSQIREVVTGYRTGFLSEIRSSRVLLDAAGIAADIDVSADTLSPGADETLAFALREAVTNVVRYSGAKTCRVTLEREDSRVVLRIHDDGGGFAGAEGNGLRGMRERAAALGGSMTCESAEGTTVTIMIPSRA